MPAGRPSSVLAHPVQWLHCAHDGTTLLPGGGVQLTWDEAAGTADPRCGTRPSWPGGLVYDDACVGYRADPVRGSVVVLPPGTSRAARCPGAYTRPRGVAVDAAGRLYVTDSAAREAVVVDLAQRRVLRRVRVGPGRPVDAARDCHRALVLMVGPGSLLRLDGRRDPRPGPALVAPRCPSGLVPARITTGPLVLWSGDGRAVVAQPDGTVEIELGAVTDLDMGPDGTLVVARAPGMSFQRFRRDAGGWVELEPVGAPGYDGGAVAHTPAGRIAYTTAAGTATTTGPQIAHVSSGAVTSYRMDSGRYRNQWGRVLLEACLPPRSSVAVRFVTSDADDVPDPIDRTPPARSLPSAGSLIQGEYPPLPSAIALEAAPGPGAVFRQPADNANRYPTDVATYEAPVHAPPGRYLWVQVGLHGTDQITPQVRTVRVERSGHGLLDSLPLAWSRADATGGFLQRYLTPAAGLLHDLDWRSATRGVLIDPAATPAEKLDWLASFAGLVLDRRWPETARRRLVAEAYPLFARRGTKAALLQLAELYLGREVRLIERWQLRGLGGTVLGIDPTGPAAPQVAGSARTTGSLGRFAVGGSTPDTDPYLSTAHQCTVLVPGRLSAEQRTVLAGLLETHRPAHVSIDVCELGAGMRVGVALRVDLSSFVGPGSGARSLVLGESGLGTDGVVGDGAMAGGLEVGSARIGTGRL